MASFVERQLLISCTVIPENFTVKRFSLLVALMKIKTDKNFTTTNLIEVSWLCYTVSGSIINFCQL